MIKTVSLLLIIIGISLVTIYLTRTGKQYMSKKENIVVSFIDFLLTEDIAFEILFILIIVFLIVFLLNKGSIKGQKTGDGTMSSI